MTCVEPIRKISQIRKIEKLLNLQSKRNLILFTIGINCGLRISDILSLNVGDVKNKNFIEIKEKKTGKFKKFPINWKLKPILDDFVKNRKNNSCIVLNIYVFLTIQGLFF